MKKNIINLLFVSSFFLTGCSETKKEDTLNKTKQSNKSEENINTKTISDVPKEDYAIISTSYGDMTIQFFEGAAPKHVESFKTHANNGFYNGCNFSNIFFDYRLDNIFFTKDYIKPKFLDLIFNRNLNITELETVDLIDFFH